MHLTKHLQKSSRTQIQNDMSIIQIRDENKQFNQETWKLDYFEWPDISESVLKAFS